MYPNAYAFWVEQELAGGLWSTLDLKSGQTTLEAARVRIQEEKSKGEPFASRRFRIVDRERRLVEAAAS